MDSEQLAYADRLVRLAAAEACTQPVDLGEGMTAEPCGEVFVCGGICRPCAARRYVERYPEPVASAK